jgi:transposase
MGGMSAIKSWTASDELWAKVEPLIPTRKRRKGRRYLRRPGGGRKPMDPRRVFAAIIFVLRTGIQWKALPKAQFGSASAVHKYFLAWKRQKVFVRLWRKGLAEYDELEGIAWAWQSIDGALVKAPLALEAVGPNPTDRGKKRHQAQPPRRREWNPAVPHRERGPAA